MTDLMYWSWIIDTNVLDWGHSNKIAVALEQSTYIWDIESKMCQKINFCAEEEAASPYFVSAVCWDNEGHLVTTGDSNGQLEVAISYITQCSPMFNPN